MSNENDLHWTENEAAGEQKREKEYNGHIGRGEDFGTSSKERKLNGKKERMVQQNVNSI